MNLLLLAAIGINISKGACSVKLDPLPGFVSKLEIREGLLILHFNE